MSDDLYPRRKKELTIYEREAISRRVLKQVAREREEAARKAERQRLKEKTDDGEQCTMF